jgi:hypothetical protein
VTVTTFDPTQASVEDLRKFLADHDVQWSAQETIARVRFRTDEELESAIKRGARLSALRKDELVSLAESVLARRAEVGQAVASSLSAADEPDAGEPEPEIGEDRRSDEDVPTDEELEEKHRMALVLREEAVAEAPALLPSVAEFSAMREYAAAVAATSMVPKAFRGKKDDVLAAILTGREMGLGPMQSLRDLFVIDGKPALAAHLLMAQLRKGGVVILDSVSSAERAWIRARRTDTGEIGEVEWTYEQASQVMFTSWEVHQLGRSAGKPPPGAEAPRREGQLGQLPGGHAVGEGRRPAGQASRPGPDRSGHAVLVGGGPGLGRPRSGRGVRAAPASNASGPSRDRASYP